MVRYDDFGFLLSDPDAVRNSELLRRIPAWRPEEFHDFQRDLEESEILIVSLSAALRGAYMLTRDGVVVRVHPIGLGDVLDVKPTSDIFRFVRIFELTQQSRMLLLEKALCHIRNNSHAARAVFVLGANTRHNRKPIPAGEIYLRRNHNMAVQQFCEATPLWTYVSIDDVVSDTNLIDDRHYTRIGYHEIAEFIKSNFDSSGIGSNAKTRMHGTVEDRSLSDIVSRGRRVHVPFELLGESRGLQGHVKRLIKMTPIFPLIRDLKRRFVSS